jgi:hypothetical protein
VVAVMIVAPVLCCLGAIALGAVTDGR